MTTSSAAEPLPSRARHRLAALAARPWLWAAWVVVVMIAMITRSVLRTPPRAPALDAPLARFSLLDQDGHPFGSDNLAGRVWVADFVSTQCPSSCPQRMRRMVEIQHRTRNLGADFHLVSFTVVPAVDTPEVLRTFGAAFHPNPRRWSFVTGAPDDVARQIAAFDVPLANDGGPSATHGERFVVVDRHHRIRGYYADSDEAIDRMMRDVGVLANLD